MKKHFSILWLALLATIALHAGAINIPIVSGKAVADIQTDMSNAVSAGNTDITLQFAKGGIWGAASSGGDIILAVPAGVTKLTLTYDPATTGAMPVIYINQLTYTDGLMTDGIFFDGVKLFTGTANRYLIAPTTTAAQFPAKISIKNCWLEGYRAVVSSTLATSTSQIIFSNNYFKNIGASGIINVNNGSISVINIRKNTFNNVGGDASGATATDYFIDFRSANSVTSQITFSQNTIYYPRTQGRGLFRLGNATFTTGFIRENNNLYASGNATTFTMQLLYTNSSQAVSDADSTNYISNKMGIGSNKGSIVTTVYTENNPSNLFVDPASDNFTINDPNFSGKIIAGNPACFYPATINITGASLINFNYNLGTGPSTSQYFTLNTVVLRAEVGIKAPAHYEISLDNSTFTDSLTVGGKGNDLSNQQIYVRLKSGLTIGTYDESVKLTSLNAVTKFVTCSGSVTSSLPALNAPTGLTANNISYTGFSAGWSAVTNASSYVLRILLNGTAVNTINNLTITSVDVTGLTPGSAYSFAVTAMGDGVNYNNSVESTPSEVINTPFIHLFTSINNTSAGTITKSPNLPYYASNASVQLTASKNFGYKFINWVDSVSGSVISTSNAITVTMDGTKHYKAVFESVNTYTFNVTIAGSPWGKVSLSPAPTDGKYEEGTNVSMIVTPNAVTTFSYWENATTATSRAITVDGNKSFTATFDEIPFIVGWDFKVADPKSARAGDYYSVSTNQGIFSMYEQNGTAVSWLSHTGWGSPSTPCTIKWTGGSSFLTNQRYYQASFKTTGYQNVQVKSQMTGSYQYYLTQKLQASLDGVNYTDVISVDLANNTWTDVNCTLPADYNNKEIVYIRWVANTASTRNGNTADSDGTSLTNVFVLADLIPVVDNEAPLLLSSVPAQAAASVSANGSIVLTFNEKVKAGTGNCTLGSKTLAPVFATKTVTFAYSKLDYNADYSFTVPAGAIVDQSGNPYAGFTLNFHTMNRPVPVAKVFDAVIAADGSGDYTNVQAAINAVPDNRTQPWLIFVKNGVYFGHVDIPANKPFVHLIGQSRDSVIISHARLSGGSSLYPDSAVYSVDPGASVVVKSPNCYFENICFENKFGFDNKSGPQALALYTMNDRVVLNNCWLRSYQDTYLTSYGNVAYRHYLKNCRIEGAVDFIYGGGDVFFDRCQIYVTRSSGGYIVAPSHQTGTKWGYVFSNCSIDGPSPSYITYLGRPWTNSPMTSFFNTTCKIGIYPAGWLEHMGAIPAIFADYNSMDANGFPLDLSNRIDQYWIGDAAAKVWGTAKKSFTDTEAATYTYENVTSGTDNWDPRTITEPTDAPTDVHVSHTGNITWIGNSYAICYIVMKNNKVIGFTTSSIFTDSNYLVSNIYKVVAVAESGALSAAVTATGINTAVLGNEPNNVFACFNADKNLIIQYLQPGSDVYVYAVSGQLLNKQKALKSTIIFPATSPCIVKVLSGNKETILKVTK